jgi:two-component system nitrate/nitrite response regulator NarL
MAVIPCAEAGAAGYVALDASVDDLVEAIERAIAGELRCSTRVAAELFHRIGARGDDRQASESAAALTVREQQVLEQLRLSLSNNEIAQVLNIAEATVKNHVHHILEKLHVMRRTQAAAQPDAMPVARARRRDADRGSVPV